MTHQPQPPVDLLAALTPDALKGVRLGVPTAFLPDDEVVMKSFTEAVDLLRKLGAEIVKPADIEAVADLKKIASGLDTVVLDTEFKVLPSSNFLSL